MDGSPALSSWHFGDGRTLTKAEFDRQRKNARGVADEANRGTSTGMLSRMGFSRGRDTRRSTGVPDPPTDGLMGLRM